MQENHNIILINSKGSKSDGIQGDKAKVNNVTVLKVKIPGSRSHSGCEYTQSNTEFMLEQKVSGNIDYSKYGSVKKVLLFEMDSSCCQGIRCLRKRPLSLRI